MSSKINQRVRSVALLCSLLFCAVASAQQEAPFRSIAYHLEMSHPASHLFEVTMQITPGTPITSFDLQMPRWSPGRYAVFDFAKNVQEVQAFAGCLPDVECQPAPLPLMRIDDQTWRIALGGTQSFTLSYKVFADDLSGTFSQLDERHADFNGGSVFMYVVDHKQDPVGLSITPPQNWRIINGRTKTIGEHEWQFPNYDIMIDTPTEIGPDWTMDQFEVEGKTYRVVVHSFSSEGGKRPELVRGIERIVRAETAMWGAPEFDSYTFLIHFAPGITGGDGMEHLNSTQIIQSGALADVGWLGHALATVAHEFFHVWNVKRLRPAELGPWDFTRPLATRNLWIAEGLTNYYGTLMLRRAGITTDEQLIRSYSETIDRVENSPGSRLMSAEEASLSAPFLDRAVHAQRTNLANTSVSYYIKGEVLGLVLDLVIRGKTQGRASLDDVMRRMYEEFYVNGQKTTYYLRGHGYTGEDFERVASEVAGINLHDFFERYVRGTETPPYDDALASVGLRLVRQNRPGQNRAEYHIEDAQVLSHPALTQRRAWLNGSPSQP